jgi:autophagy-related protein 2
MLTDLSLDIDKLQSQYLPPTTPISFRDAFVKTLYIQINTNGIQLKIDEIDCVVSPKADIENSLILDPSSSSILKGLEDPMEGLDGMMESVVGFVDAVSGVNSFMSGEKNSNRSFNDDVVDDDDDDDDPSDKSKDKVNLKTAQALKDILEKDKRPGDDPQITDQTRRESNGLMNYAVDYIMGKVSVSIRNVFVKVIADPIVIGIKIDQLSVTGDKQERKCDISGIKIGLIKPDVSHNEGDGQQSEDEPMGDRPDLKETSKEFADTDAEVDELNDRMMASSFMAMSKDDMEQSIIESAMYSTSGKSVYMSAMQDDYEAPQMTNTGAIDYTDKENSRKLKNMGTIIVGLDIIRVSLKERKLLSIEIGILKISADPLPALASSFLTFLIHLKKQKIKVKQQTPNDLPKSGSTFKLELFSIDEISISIDSVLDEFGSFVNENSLIIRCTSILLEQKSTTFLQGSLNKLEVFHQNQKCFYFDDSVIKQPDVILEIQTEKKSSIASIILSKPIIFGLDFSIIQILLHFYHKLDKVWMNMEELKVAEKAKQKNRKSVASKLRLSEMGGTRGSMYGHSIAMSMSGLPSRRKPKSSLDISFQTHTIKGTMGLSENCNEQVDISIAPATYDSIKKLFQMDYVTVDIATDSGSLQLSFDQFGYSGNTNGVLDTFRSIDPNTQKPMIYNTEKMLTVDNIELSASYKTIKNIIKLYKSLKGSLVLERNDRGTQDIQKKPSKAVKFEKGRMNHSMMASSMMAKTKTANFFMLVKNIAYDIHDIKEDFGGISGNLENIGICDFPEGMRHLFVDEISMFRTKEEIREVIIKRSSKWITAPMLFIKKQQNLNLSLNNWVICYSGKWLAMFEKEIEEELGQSEIIIDDKNDISKVPHSNDDAKIKVSFEINFSLKDVTLSLRPVNLDSGALVLLHTTNVDAFLYSDRTASIQLTCKEASLLLIDDVCALDISEEKLNHSDNWEVLSMWKSQGYVQIGALETLLLKLKINTTDSIYRLMSPEKLEHGIIRSLIDTQIDIDKLCLNLCCDSAQCFIQLLKDLKKPVYFSYDDKYKDHGKEINVFDSIDANFFKSAGGADNTAKTGERNGYGQNSAYVPTTTQETLNFVDDFYEDVNQYTKVPGSSSKDTSSGSSISNVLDINSDHFVKSPKKDHALVIIPLSVHVTISQADIALHDGYDWKETRSQIRRAYKKLAKKAREVREEKDKEIRSQDESQSRVRGNAQYAEDDDAFTRPDFVEETLYQSILLEIDTNDNPRRVSKDVSTGTTNRGSEPQYQKIQQQQSHTIDLGKKGTVPLKLRRSRKSKTNIVLEYIDVNFTQLSIGEPHLADKPTVFSSVSDDVKVEDSEYLNQIEITVADFVVIDNVPTSSWNMFAGYLRDAGEREIGKNMIRVAIDLVRPISELAAIEMVMHVSVLPLRLYIDQDTLDFVTRFAEFKDQRFIPVMEENEEMFIEKLTVDTVKLKLDYKPKKIDYAGIRSGHSGEFVNIFILDGSEITLNKVTLYGVAGFSKLNNLLNGFWSPDVKRNQLGGVLSGLAPFRSIINIGIGMNSLVSVPMKEYQKDGRLLRSLQAGAYTFGKVTSGELLKLGAKLAAGTQTILESTEEALGGSGASARVVIEKSETSHRKRSSGSDRGGRRRSSTASFRDEDEEDYKRYFCKGKQVPVKLGDGSKRLRELEIYNEFEEDECAIDDSDEGEEEMDDEDEDEEEEEEDGRRRDGESYVVSLYSNQPSSLNEGLRVAYNSIQKNLSTARDAVYAAGVKAKNSDSTTGAVMELARAAPVVMIRPAIAATEAISKGLLGGANAINPEEQRRAEEKYKNHQSVED